MIPPTVLAGLPATLAEIGELAAGAADLITMIRKFPQPLDFVNRLLRTGKGITRVEAGMAYRVARYFKDQGKYLSGYPADVPLDRRLAGVSQVPAASYDATRPYRYEVTLQAYSPGNRMTQELNIYVPSKYLLTREGAIEQALGVLQDRLQSKYKIKIDDSAVDDWRNSASVVKFTRFEPGG